MPQVVLDNRNYCSTGCSTIALQHISRHQSVSSSIRPHLRRLAQATVWLSRLRGARLHGSGQQIVETCEAVPKHPHPLAISADTKRAQDVSRRREGGKGAAGNSCTAVSPQRLPLQHRVMSTGPSASGGGGGGGSPLLTEEQIVGRYKQLRGELGAISQKINELEADVRRLLSLAQPSRNRRFESLLRTWT